jgi:uncharacterized protein (TIGR02145 family)
MYDPDLYKCKSNINPNGIYLKTPVGYEGEDYEAVLIGTQTWLARNLNYNAPGSKCGSGSSLSDDNTACDTYGRLYNWETAMVLPNCNTTSCSGQIQSPHQGVCPDGWHIPSSEDWGKLSRYADGSTDANAGYASTTAGRYLKAASGWNSNGNGTDDYGFSALPGGYGYSDGSFDGAGYYGYWWSASEDGSSYAYHRGLYYNFEYAYWGNYSKSYLFSVRCLQD